MRTSARLPNPTFLMTRALGFLLAMLLVDANARAVATAQDRQGSSFTLDMIEAGLPKTYAAAPIRADVVEEKTGFALEGVHVVARWEVRHVVGGRLPSFVVQEAITDSKGQFVIPGFAPRPRPSGAFLFYSPQLILFKPGFRPLKLSRNEPKESLAKHFPNYKSMSAKAIDSVMSLDGAPDRAIQTSFWDEMTIGLESFNGSEEEWLRELETVAGSIRDDEAPFARNMLTALRGQRSGFNTRRFSDSERRNFGALFLRVDRLLEGHSRR